MAGTIKTYTPIANGGGYINHTLRSKHSVAVAGFVGTSARIRVHVPAQFGDTGWTFVELWIGKATVGGNVLDMIGAVQVLFGGLAAGTVPPGGLWSDWVDIAVADTDDLIISAYTTHGAPPYLFTSSDAGLLAGAQAVGNTAAAEIFATASNGYHFGAFGFEIDAAASDSTQVVAALGQIYDLQSVAVLAALAQEYNLMFAVANGLDQKWGMILEQVLTQYYDDAPLVAAGLGQHWGNSPLVMQGLDQKWDDALQVAAVLLQKYNLMYAPVSGLEQRWEICGSQAMVGLDQQWDIRAVTEIMAALGQYWGLYKNGAVIQAPVFSVMADGILLSPSSFSWTLSEGSHSLEASVVLPSQAQYNSIQHHGHLEISWNGRVYEFFIESKNRSRTVSDEEFRVDYTLSCLSLTAGLDAPYSLPMTRSWENTMMASAIVIELADGIPVDWQIADFSVPGNSFFANNETPLAVIKKLVGGSVEAIVQTSHDGTIIVRREFPVSPAKWLETPADYTISDDGGVFTDSEVDDIEEIYNMVTVTDRMESDESLRLEQELVSVYEKIVCGYQVPWAGDFVLRTSGGLWVDILDDGIVEEEITETVEFVDGAGRTAKPVYLSDLQGRAFTLEVTWLHTQLGAVTSAEDGSLASEVVGNSLAEITYLTRFRKWRVINRRKVEKVQCFVEVVE